ncbi:MAG: hypothetical protein ACFCD0_17780 [Gemmataceae bacterium]
MSHHSSPRLQLESLERRDCPAINYFLDGLGNITVTGVPDPAGLVVTVAAPNTYTIQNGANTVLDGLSIPGGLTIRTGGSNDTVTVSVESGALIGGNVFIDTGAGTDGVEILGANALTSTILGNVNISGINTGFPNAVDSVTVGGFVQINNFQENDGITFDLLSSIVGNDFFINTGNGTDVVTINESTVGGQAFVQLGNSLGGIQTFSVTSGATVGRNLTVLAGNLDDSVVLSGTIGGSAYVNLGNSLLSNTLAFNTGSTIGGQFTYIGGNGIDNLDTFAGSIGGSVFVNLMGGASNNVDFTGSMFGRSFVVLGGSGVDTFSLGATAAAPLASFYASFGAGDDTVTLDVYPFTRLFVNLGSGNNDFNQPAGVVLLFATVLNA